MSDSAVPSAAKADREKKCEDILDVDMGSIPDEIQELLCNFNNTGYNLLYFILHDFTSNTLKNLTPELYKERMEILETYKNEMSSEEHSNSGSDKKKKAAEREKELKENSYYHMLYKNYCDAANAGKSQKIWQETIVKKCQKKLEGFYNNDMDNALKYVVALQNIDKNATFFWDVLPEDTILKNISKHSWEGDIYNAK